ncbi:MAG: hypothetical protein R2724_11965 [Bryobacterales bacterium]
MELADVGRGAGKLALRIEPEGNVKYRVEFFGAGGKKLGESFGTEAEYALKGGEAYVRAQVLDSNGLRAWTQPVFAN